jgi:DegV family protein with EDD domain
MRGELNMRKVAIMTDSLSTIPQQMAQEYDIKVMPLYVVMDGKDYAETEIDRAEIYARIREKDNSFTTSSISPGIYLKTWRELSQKAESVLCITHASSMGMSYKSAIQAKEMAREKMPQIAIEVIDSHNVCAAQLLLVLAAAKAAAQGKSLSEVSEVVNSIVPRLSLVLLNPSQRLVKGGRAVTKAGLAESGISTQYIMEIGASTRGIMTVFARARTRAKGMEKLIEIVKHRSKSGKLHAAINYVAATNEAEELKKRLLAQFQCAELDVTEDSLIPLVHEGLEVIKLGWYSE